MARGKGKLASALVTKLQGAVSRSRTRTPGPEDDAEFERNTQAAIANAPTNTLTYEQMQREPTEAEALEFAKLLRSGVPQPDALAYTLGSVEPGVIELALPRWMKSRLVVDALATLNGGRWPALEPDARLDISLDKHYAEMAHFLYTHDFETAEGRDLGKLNVARESLEKLRVGRMEQNSPFVKFLQSILKPTAIAAPLAIGDGDGRGDATRPATMGLVEVVDAEVTETEG